jgi:rSAM/selenodomain-associated transferase 2
MMQKAPLSIVIPTLNAMPRLVACLTALVEGLVAGLVCEVIVVDGGSDDTSVALARDMGCKVVEVGAAGRGRGAQLIAGHGVAKGDWLLFLHGDTILPAGWSEVVLAHLHGANADKAAYFQLGFDQGGRRGGRVAAMANWRAGALGLPYGDAGLVISRAHYQRVGGYRALNLMEDVDLVRRIGTGGLVGLPIVAQTSAAKYERGGWTLVPLRNLTLLAAFLMGVNPTTLARWYK